MAKKIIFIISLIIVAAPYFSFAVGRAGGIPYWGTNPLLLSCTGGPVTFDADGKPINNTNACKSLCDIIDTGVNAIYLVMTLAIFVATPILFAWGGIMIMTAGASPGNMESGKKILKGTLIGLLIVLLSFTMIKTIVTVFGVNLPGINAPLSCS